MTSNLRLMRIILAGLSLLSVGFDGGPPRGIRQTRIGE
jgi:hypothetical protein